ncbi:MAG: signal peptide peptidase SppA [Xanthomonadales bacterium]|nr:signal peptide peptidase SppA [Xanthomonadales bacterium]
MANERSFLAKIALGTWNFINGARKVFLNLVFLFILYLLYLALQPPETFRLKPDTTLVIRPYGNVVEQYTTTPLDRALQEAAGQERSETRLRDLLEAIHRAAGDDDITQLVIDPNYMWRVGLAALKDIEHALDAFRSTGKPVIAVAENIGQQQYYLASLADEVWLDPNGVIWIDGYSNYRHFYREGLEKLAVEINLFRVGSYKSAMEPYTRDNMSEEARANGMKWLGNLWEQYLQGVSRHRGLVQAPLESSILQAAINDLPNQIEKVDGNFAQHALDLGLVDRLMTAPEARQELARRGTSNQAGDSYRAVGMEDYLALTKPRHLPGGSNRIAIVVAEGEIVRGHHPAGRIGSISTAEQLRRAARDEEVAAIVLRINSPGGEVFATESLRQEIQLITDAGKTVVVSMGNVAASGGYWISTAASEVWASPATITGSIGVIGMLPTFGSTLDKIGVHADGIGTTEMAGKLRLDRPLDEGLSRIFQSSVERNYRQFLQVVSEARGIDDLEAVDALAQGQVWTGEQARERDLVDKTGTFQDAIEASARIAGLGDDYQIEWIEPEKSALDEFLTDFLANTIAALDLSVSRPMSLPVSWLQGMLDDLQFIAAQQGKFTLAAHCLCEI